MIFLLANPPTLFYCGDVEPNSPNNPTLNDVLIELRSIKTTIQSLQADVQELKVGQEAILLRLDRLEQEVHINHHYYQTTRKALHTAGTAFIHI